MSPLVVLVHGWSFDPRMWEGVVAHLPDLECVTIDFGYFGSHPSPASPLLQSDRRIIAVGHSLGVLWLLTQAEFDFQALVSINGFPRFLEATGFTPAVRPGALTLLRRQFLRDPLQALARFRAEAGAPPIDTAPHRERLLQGLDWLAELDGRARLAQKLERTWALAGAHDAVVPLAMSRQAFGALPAQHFIVDERPGHVLPLTDPARCAEPVRRALQSL